MQTLLCVIISHLAMRYHQPSLCFKNGHQTLRVHLASTLPSFSAYELAFIDPHAAHVHHSCSIQLPHR